MSPLPSDAAMGDRMPFALEWAKRSVLVTGKLRRLPIFPAIAQWVSPVSMNDKRCERLRSESLLREESSTFMKNGRLHSVH